MHQVSVCVMGVFLGLLLVPMTLLPALTLLFSYWLALSSLYMRDFTLSYCACFVICVFHLLVASSFLKKKQRWIRSWENGRCVWENKEEWRVGKFVGMYYESKGSIFNLKRMAKWNQSMKRAFSN